MPRPTVAIDEALAIKRCAKCKEWKAFDEFHTIRSGRKAGKPQAYCKPCGLLVNAEWRDRYRPRLGGLKSRANVSLQTLAETRRKQREYRQANKERIRWANRLRFQKQRAAGAMPPRCDIGAMMCEQNALCIYCHMVLSDKYHIDHKTPISRGGGNEASNLQLLCVHCNIEKRAMTHEEYLRYRAEKYRPSLPQREWWWNRPDHDLNTYGSK